ncbi:MAG: Stp1/IreP family PP2C-type Ser/Thr phosphatase [Moorella sp. (in: Bacteria)]|nr:Stp1/IreP family PP2C-type Ser/Thr phosphatase [Moorella sp. (in: firmicutes)]
MRWSQATDPGRVRRSNEDYVCACAELGFFAVADGMGGHQAGEVASKLALEGLERFLRNYLRSGADYGEILVAGVQEANSLVYQMAASCSGCQGMGTTLSGVLVRNCWLYLAHVGDSRIYLFREGKITQLTRDHSVVQEMVRNGGITAEQAKCHPYRHVLTRALGVEPRVEVDTARLRLHPRDRILLCTDGLSGLVDEQELGRVVFGNPDLERAVHLLVELALQRGGPDNISVILVAVD